MAGERLLIVEDEGIVAADLENLLQKLGYEVVGTAPTGEEAVEKAEALAPNLVLMDIRLKGAMDGIDAAEQIIARFNIPVTYLTAYADEKTLERAKMTMPYGYVLKPFQERDLRTAVELALYKHKTETLTTAISAWHANTLRDIPEAIVATDKQGRVTFMNDMSESLSGWKFHEAYGKPLEDILSLTQESSAAPATISVEQIMRSKSSQSSKDNLVLTAKGGRKVRVQYRAVPSKDAEENILGALIVLRELSPGSSPEMAASGKPRAQ